ncbi:MAG TPA: AlkA N-terminal domain-containing protein [Actinomycetes bacterium]|jgi:AraC family transcriptional regulator of adaptative response / DNA-3-methyladenine glycosylase II|nr:AlkA N-terminal domain-containing protein [Actinomycetes bacterium]
MDRDFETYRRALASRDARFDGHFFIAVTSTGVYCRPICPAQTPKPENVCFYRFAAAAEAAGFRACRRCRPDASPGSAEWNVRADLVARALRLIAEGVVDAEGVEGLAARLAVSERHLHRQLVAEVGTGPLALARTRRCQTARVLVEQTALPLTEVAFAAGFSSIRQFNDSMRAAFGRTPTELRRHARRPGAPPLDSRGVLTLRLAYRPPFDAPALLGFLQRRAIAGIEEIGGERLRRLLSLPNSAAIAELEPLPKANQVQLRLRLDDLRDLGVAVQRCRQWLDLDAEPAAVGEVLGADPVLAPLVDAHPGLRVPGAVDAFEMAVRAIIGQRISVAGATTLTGRMVAALGEPLATPDGGLQRRFPTPERLAEADLDRLGVTKARVAALRALARAVVKGDVELDRGADRARTIAALLALPGVGPWTVAYVAMRALGDPDAFPATDLGLRYALAARGLPTEPRDITDRAERWRPWRAYAIQHLWTSLGSTAPAQEYAA